VSSNQQKVCSVNKVLVIQAIYAGDKVELKMIWEVVPDWECRILAVKSTSTSLIYFYVFGWDKRALQACTIIVD